MSADRTPSERGELLALKEEAERLGCAYGMDFYVHSFPGFTSSEVIMLDVDGDEYVIVYSDMGREDELGRTRDPAVARELFLEKLARMAGPRGRGPYAGMPPRSRFEGMSQREAYEAMQREGRMPADLSWDDLVNDLGADNQREG